ncbi:hypothetical protein LEP1GSC043_3707 [Leptospira weilii str. Ecochallenge]|uniref:Uncharacterized protein n=1 Tax=Leptospira weilii str. Ecochallenge TaxID=1049986 RepID=N1TVH8_9LEPT|nr:hypothetical protein LEP1GSC043_3707 [Leptospira weilii str. Ecochallenge]
MPENPYLLLPLNPDRSKLNLWCKAIPVRRIPEVCHLFPEVSYKDLLPIFLDFLPGRIQ